MNSYKKLLSIPDAWLMAKEWAQSVESFSTDVISIWHKTCEKTIGARTLEIVVHMTENGAQMAEISKFASGYKRTCLDELQVQDMAEWQKNDLIKYKQSGFEFLENQIRQRKGLRNQIKELGTTWKRYIKQLKIMRIFFDISRFPYKSIPH